MGISNANKELSASGIACGGSFKIKLSLTAEPNIVTNPTDIVLILDRSKSMAGSPLANLKKARKPSSIFWTRRPTARSTANSDMAAASES